MYDKGSSKPYQTIEYNPSMSSQKCVFFLPNMGFVERCLADELTTRATTAAKGAALLNQPMVLVKKLARAAGQAAASQM